MPETRFHSLPRGLALFLVVLCLACLSGCIKKKNKPPEPADTRLAMASPSGIMREVLDGKDSKIVGGGWGYVKEQAMVLRVPPDERGKAMDYSPLVNVMIELRNLEEFTRAPELGKRFEVTGFFSRKDRRLLENGKTYLHIAGSVSLVAEKDLNKARELVDKANGGGLDVHDVLEPLTTTVERDYWFDITEPVSHNEKQQKAAQKNDPGKTGQATTKKEAPAQKPSGKSNSKPASKPTPKPAQKTTGKK